MRFFVDQSFGIALTLAATLAYMLSAGWPHAHFCFAVVGWALVAIYGFYHPLLHCVLEWPGTGAQEAQATRRHALTIIVAMAAVLLATRALLPGVVTLVAVYTVLYHATLRQHVSRHLHWA